MNLLTEITAVPPKGEKKNNKKPLKHGEERSVLS